ncbi:MAG: antibiotic biosynthesis monooxygenase [Hyphomicrobiales bacterium]|nr:antibiotic biosynthesis monooxygenase [Hyphomicrobiales bacterium]
MAYAVFVTFRIKPGQMDAFLPLMVAQARNSIENEPACSIFEVWRMQNDPDIVQLYEIYEDEAAFQAHLASEHFLTFDAAIGGMIAEKSFSYSSLRMV